jgi:dTDP-glucose 4,6-dehydratase/UDP-glucose 4-epimerase
MKVLIIGAGGFIGSHLCYFFEQQQYDVTSCSTKPNQHKKSFLITNAEKDFSTIFASEKFDLCINASGSSTVGFSIKHVKQDHFLNVTLTQYLLEALAVHSPQTKLIHISSSAVYGQTIEEIISESHPTNPYSPYGQHKLEAEKLCQSFNLPIVHCRAFSVYGTGLKKQLFWDLYQKALHKDWIECYGTGKETRDYIYIEDLMQAIHLIVQHASFDQEVINLGNGNPITTQYAAKTFLDALQCNKKIIFNDQQRRGDPQQYCADNTLLKNLGYQSQVSFEEGLKRYVAWLENI